VRVPHNERLTRDLDFRWLVKNLVTPDRYGKGLGPAQMIDRRVCICTNAQLSLPRLRKSRSCVGALVVDHGERRDVRRHSDPTQVSRLLVYVGCITLGLIFRGSAVALTRLQRTVEKCTLRFGEVRFFCVKEDLSEVKGYTYDYPKVMAVVVRARHQHLDIRFVTCSPPSSPSPLLLLLLLLLRAYTNECVASVTPPNDSAAARRMCRRS